MISSKAVLMLVLCVLVVGCVRLTDENGRLLDIGKDDAEYYVHKAVDLQTSAGGSLFANVKGSTYATGELMSVFGTCLDDNQLPVSNTTALFTAWYPNGTKFIINIPMQEVQPGYFLFRYNMSAVQGTYLTEMKCDAIINNGTHIGAAAWGEWQNPLWVSQINGTAGAVQNISDMFNTTWNMLGSINSTVNASFYNLTNQIYQISIITNNTENNTNYIIQLLQNISSITVPSGNLTHTEDADSAVYMREWNIVVTAYGVGGKKVQYPDAMCYISTTQTYPAVPMTPQGTDFIYGEVIRVHGTFNWVVTCQYV